MRQPISRPLLVAGAGVLLATAVVLRRAEAQAAEVSGDPFFDWPTTDPITSEALFGFDTLQTEYWMPIEGAFMTGSSQISLTGLSLIKRFEGLRLTAYQDSGGVWTIGYGHTGPDVYAGLTISTARANAFLSADVAGAEAAVSQLVTMPLSQGQFDALVSLVYNIGSGAFRDSTLRRKLNTGDYAGAAAEFDRWVYAGQTLLSGLVARRNAEQTLFTAG